MARVHARSVHGRERREMCLEQFSLKYQIKTSLDQNKNSCRFIYMNIISMYENKQCLLPWRRNVEI